MEALRYLAKERALVAELTEIVKVQPGELKERVAALVTRVRDAERELEKLRREQVQAATGKLVEYAHDVHGVRVLTHDAGDGTTADDLRTMVLDLRGRLGDAGPVGRRADRRGQRPARPSSWPPTPARASAASRPAPSCGVAAQTLGGGGGGKDDLAQGGGTDATRTGEALGQVDRAVEAASQGAG